MSRIACPHCSKPIHNDPALAGSAALCPHCQRKFQFPEAPTVSETPAAEIETLSFVAERGSSAAPTRASSRTKAQAPAKSKSNVAPQSDVKPKPGERSKTAGKSKGIAKEKATGKNKATGKEKPEGKEKPAGFDLKAWAPKIGMGVGALVVLVGMFVYSRMPRDYSAEKRAVQDYIARTMPKAKLDSWGGEGISKGCTTTNGVKIPDNGVVVRAHVKMPGKFNFKKDIVFIVVNGRVTDEIDRQNFRLPGK